MSGYKCPCCGKIEQYFSLLTEHINEEHPSQHPFSCNVCLQSFRHAGQLAKHKHDQHSTVEASQDENSIIVELGAGGLDIVGKYINVRAIGLVRCLFLVHVPFTGETYQAWHIDGYDINYLLNATSIRQDYRLYGWNMRGLDIEIAVSNARAEDWKRYVLENPGESYLCGPDAGEQESNFFNIHANNVTRTREGPISPMFIFASRSFIV